jgi:two-component system sensor histidine kinase MprB
LLATAISAALVAAYVVVKGELTHTVDSSLRTRAASIATFQGGFPSRPRGIVQPPRSRIVPPKLGELEGYIQFVSANGKVTLTPGERTKLPVSHAQAVAQGRHQSYFFSATVDGTPLRIYVRRSGSSAIELARSVRDVDNALGWIRRLFEAISAVAIAATALLAFLVARALLRPIERLTADAERIAETRDPSIPVAEGRSDEVGRLARTFNAMLRALGESLTAQRQLVADASHELRTPLTTARTEIETIRRHPDSDPATRNAGLDAAVEELTEMSRLIDELVALARGDLQPSAREPVRLDQVAAGVVETARRRSGREIVAHLEPTVVDGASDDLARAISNLIDNALKWSDDPAPVEVTVSNGTCSVRDFGSGVAPNDLPRIFDRFYRATDARRLPGSGLGLAIVRQVAEAHGGNATAAPADGCGTVFTIAIPAV